MKFLGKLFSIVLLIFSFSSNAQEEELIVSNDSLDFYVERILEKEELIKVIKLKSMRVSYIYLNGSKLSINEINNLRKTILLKFEKGVPFAELANKYTMDGTKDGDLGWFNEGMMVKSFEDEIKKHRKGAIFTVDIPEKKWYYVVYKTFDEVEKYKLVYRKK